MEYKFAVALLTAGEEKILGLFDSKEDADEYGRQHKIPRERGLQYCYSSLFTRNGQQRGDMRAYDYYDPSADRFPTRTKQTRPLFLVCFC